MIDLATITAAIAAATSAVGLIDKIGDQIDRFINRQPEPDVPVEHSYKIEKEGDAIVSNLGGQRKQKITAQDLQNLPLGTLKHIQVLEKSMNNHYNIWAAVYPTLALTVDPIAKAKIEQQLRDIIADMKGDLEAILDFLEKDCRLELDDHYLGIRNLVRSV